MKNDYVTDIAEINEIFANDLKETKKLEQALKDTLNGSINAYNREELENKRESKKYDVAKAIHNQMQYVRNAAIGLFMIIAMALTSCNKIPTEAPQDTLDQIHKELITQLFTVDNITSQMHSKGFDPLTWKYNYTTQAGNLIFTSTTDPRDNVSKSVTIQELITGIKLDIFADTYNITYTTTDADNSLVNIKISMPSTKVDGTPIYMTANFNSYLLVIDMAKVKSVIWSNTLGWGQPPDFILLNGFYYSYCNITEPYEVAVTFNDDSNKHFTLAGKVCGQVYWFTSPIGATTELSFPEWIVNKIVLE